MDFLIQSIPANQLFSPNPESLHPVRGLFYTALSYTFNFSISPLCFHEQLRISLKSTLLVLANEWSLVDVLASSLK
jgi:hypothetical protein